MDQPSIFSHAKHYCVKASLWLLMVFAAAATVILIGHFFLPYTMQLINPTVKENYIAGNENQQYKIQEIIKAVRSELIAAQSSLIANEEDPMFQAETFDLELSFVVARGVKANTKVETPIFLVVGADTDYKEEQIQKIRLHWSVVEPPTWSGANIDEVPNSDEKTINLN
jgi:hypothetical protein